MKSPMSTKSKAPAKRGKQKVGDRLTRIPYSTRKPIDLWARRPAQPIPWPRRSLRFRPQLPTDRKLLALPLSDDDQLVGTAFEHLMRLELQRLNPIADLGRCLAAYAVDLAELAARSGESVQVGVGLVPSPSGRGVATVYSRSLDPEHAVQQLRAAAESRSREYIQNGVLTSDLLTSCWRVAKIIGSFRQAYRDNSVLIPFDLLSTDGRCLKDIEAMFNLIDREAFRAQQRCLLRPTFCGEHPVGANQPDFVIDDMIIDVKCTARNSLDRRNVDQLLDYYALSRIEGLAEHGHGGEINRLAIYYARFAQLFVIDVRTDFPRERIIKFLKWFEGKYRRTGETER